MWLTYVTAHPCIDSTYLNLEVLCILRNCRLLDCEFASKLSTNYTFLASGIRVEKNLKALFMKTTKSLSGVVRREILSFINKNLGRSHYAE